MGPDSIGFDQKVGLLGLDNLQLLNDPGPAFCLNLLGLEIHILEGAIGPNPGEPIELGKELKPQTEAIAWLDGYRLGLAPAKWMENDSILVAIGFLNRLLAPRRCFDPCAVFCCSSL